MADLLIFRSMKLFEADLIAAAFEEKSIPFYRRRDAGGMEQAMPAAPSQFPGVFWSIYIPVEMEAEARAIIDGSLVDRDRESKWEPSPVDVRQWHYFLTAVTVAMAIIVYMKCFGR